MMPFPVLLLKVSILLSIAWSGDASAEDEAVMEYSEHEEGGHPAHAVLYPSFVLTLGVVVYFLLSRFLHWLPYTAVMFLLGVIMGLVAATEALWNPNKEEHIMHDALVSWQSIDSEVLLLVFLPGLIFKDALGQNPYLFAIGFGQLFIFAFPLVLAGTALTACVGYYILPNDWPFFLCLTFGSILSATDPVAVAALLEEVGAPPRLTTHIAGESLLNDGAAIVFFSIFSSIYLSETGIPGMGEEIGWAKGVTIFIQKAIGGCAIGFVAGGVIILTMTLLNRRFSKEENIVQVTAVLAMVYLNYFVAEVVCLTSGVIATLAAGLSIKFFGRGAINNIYLMDDFFSVTEHILNTILFCLGGLVWGETIYDNYKRGFLTGQALGYLVLLYVLLHVIRAVLFISVYPITSRIGLKTNWKETSFQIYGGLRGAVGIALAIFLDNEVDRPDDSLQVRTEQDHVDQVYFMVGGIAFLTLFINGATAGPLLKWLGLADSTETREKIIEAYRVHLRSTMIDSCVNLLTHERFKSIDFSFVQERIPILADLTIEQLVEAVKKMKETTEANAYKPPYLQDVLAVITDNQDLMSQKEKYDILCESPETHAHTERMERRKRARRATFRSSMANMMKGDPLSTVELRLLFISMLRAQYESLINEGLLASENGLTIALEQSLEVTKTEVNKGGQLNDLNHLKTFHTLATKYTKIADKGIRWLRCNDRIPDEYSDLRSLVLLEFAFTNAHERAQEFFQDQLGDADSDLSEGGKIVLSESKAQVEEVRKHLNSKDSGEIVIEVSTHRLCDVLLNQGIVYVENLVKFGLLKESEAEDIIHELTDLQKQARCAEVHSARQSFKK